MKLIRTFSHCGYASVDFYTRRRWYQIINIITSNYDTYLLQKVIDSISQWGEVNSLLLNRQKCDSITFSKKNNQYCSLYKITSENLRVISWIRDFKVLLDKNWVPLITYTTFINITREYASFKFLWDLSNHWVIDWCLISRTNFKIP